MSRRLAFTAVFLLACGSGSPAKAPQSGSSEEPASSSIATAPDSQPEAEDKPAAAKEKEPSGPVSNQDLQSILQLVIDDEALEPYLHLDKPNRFPFRIAGDLPQGLELTKATKPVVFVADPASEKKPVLVFTDVKVEGDEASVRYRYDVEKVRGASSLKKRDRRWVLSRSRVTEH